MISTIFVLLLASVVQSYSWLSSDPEYSEWSHGELRTWLERQKIKVPPSFDKSHLYDLVDANWNTPAPSISTYAEPGQQRSSDWVLGAFEHIRDDTFDKWDESRLRAFLLEQGVVPSGPREQLVFLAKNKYRAYTDTAAHYSSLASGSASSLSASASGTVAEATHQVARAIDETRDYVYSAWDNNRLRKWLEDQGIVEAKKANTREDLLSLAGDYYRKANSAIWESWSDSYIREWLIAHHLLEPNDTPSRPSLVGEMKKYYYNSTDKVWNAWSDSELKAWLVDHGFLETDARKHRDDMVAIVEKHYLSALDSIWGAWTDSDIRHWLSEQGHLESANELGDCKNLVGLMNLKHPDASVKVPSYLLWPDSRLRAYLRERGASYEALPTNRAGLLHQVRLLCKQTLPTNRANTVLARFGEIVDSYMESVEGKVARALEILSGGSQDAACHASEQTRQVTGEAEDRSSVHGAGGEL